MHGEDLCGALVAGCGAGVSGQGALPLAGCPGPPGPAGSQPSEPGPAEVELDPIFVGRALGLTTRASCGAAGRLAAAAVSRVFLVRSRPVPLHWSCRAVSRRKNKWDRFSVRSH